MSKIMALLTSRRERARDELLKRIVATSRDLPLNKLTVGELMELLDAWGIAGWGLPDNRLQALERRIVELKATVAA